MSARFHFAQLWILLFSVTSFLGIPGKSILEQPDTQIIVRYLSLSGVDLASLLRGEYGEGLLLYSKQTSPSAYQLAVKLSKPLGSPTSRAEIIQLPDDDFNSDQSGLADRILALPPAITIDSLDGWWLKDSIPSYNLDVLVSGAINAIWGAGDDQTSNTSGWLARPPAEEPTVRIIVRDEDKNGIPDWELRTLLPVLHGRADILSTYAESKCDSPLSVDPGVFPAWPYITNDGGFNQGPGRFRPPVVVDFKSGLITHFSELVSVRYQNCSYSFYTLDSLKMDALNTTNFEAPFAFYDLSGEGKDYPNLILRTEHYPAGDRWFNHFSWDFETVRYSWRNAVGDGRWDYKIEVAGFQPFLYRTPIAGGGMLVDAPSYEDFPSWVIQNSWPAVTFVDTGGSRDTSSEGIYAWSPRAVGDGYLRGEVDQPDLSPFSEIQAGWRGEYRFSSNTPPSLYASPVDNRLHLLGAEAGMLNLGEGLVLREGNLDRDLYIDAWVLEENPSSEVEESPSQDQGVVKAVLYALGQYLVYSGGGEVILHATAFSPASFEILPPTDPPSWSSFIQKVEPFRDGGKDPLEMRRWLEDFPGRTLWLSGASISNVVVSSGGFQFLLELQPGYQVSGEKELLPISGREAGVYLVNNHGAFSLESLSPVNVNLTIGLSSLSPGGGSPAVLKVVARNRGLQSLHDLTLTASTRGNEQANVVSWQLSDLQAGEKKIFLASCPPSEDGSCWVHAEMKDVSGTMLARQEMEFFLPDNRFTIAEPYALLLGPLPLSTTPVVILVLVLVLFSFVIRVIVTR